MFAIGAGSCDSKGDTKLPGAAAAGAAAATGAAGVAAVGSAGIGGRFTEAVAVPGGGVAGAAAGVAAPDMTDARLCINCGAAACTVDSWLNSCAPGFGGAGAGAGTGSAAAVALSDSAVAAPAAAIMVETSSFLVRYMVLPIVGRRRPEAEAIPLLV